MIEFDNVLRAALFDYITVYFLEDIRVTKNNRYGHPAPELPERLRERGIPWKRTDLEGAAVITSHSLRELEDTCDMLALMHKGGLIPSADRRIAHLEAAALLCNSRAIPLARIAIYILEVSGVAYRIFDKTRIARRPVKWGAFWLLASDW